MDLLIAVSKFARHFLDHKFHHLNISHFRLWLQDVNTTQPPVMGVSARTTMTGTIKCVTLCKLQDSVIQQKVERILLFRVIPENIVASMSFLSLRGVSLKFHVFVFSCFDAAFVALTHVSWWCWTCAMLKIFFRSDVTCDQAVPVCILKS